MELTSQLRHVQNNNVNISKVFSIQSIFNTTLTFKNSALESRNVILNLLINCGDKQSVHVMISQLRHTSNCDGVDCDGVDIFK